MLSLLNIIRYFVFVVFIICNAIITSVAVWNLAIVETIELQSIARHVDSFLIFVGASGLLLVFTILFFELYGKTVFLVRVWFELVWTGTFSIMELVGAAVITAQSTSMTCASSQDSPCASTQVLQAFTWILAILLLGYLTLLSILTLVKWRDDPTIWHCSVRKFPLMTDQSLKSPPASPSVPRFRGPPIIVAPIPRRIPAREAILSYRSGLSLEYDIEHFQAPESALHAHMSEEQALSPVSITAAAPPPQIARPVESAQQTAHPAISSPFYHTAVQTALDDQPNQPQVPAPAHMNQIRRLPPSPPPLGDWPRLDATARPRMKRKPLPQLLPAEPENSVADSRPQPEPQPQRRQSRPLPRPQLQPSAPSPYTFDAPALAAALQPVASQSRRSKPSGPRRNTSIDDGRPTDLDLSNISTFRSPGFS
ncbi:hypothetical protein GALMADRAFT_239505 [Galerina marginata CBS 339.88]|uniref:Uncharacterized protein n=1 Tax=Galerina marginata (strain CBS 339.88) TaxID=685588 RepID=A0A067TEF6_GALM3|nr:hypothetical protein GALMADRAFT_239505 [Galerina marginata CBS 339.88]